jgi:hypothetical protein
MLKNVLIERAAPKMTSANREFFSDAYIMVSRFNSKLTQKKQLEILYSSKIDEKSGLARKHPFHGEIRNLSRDY